MGNIQAIVLAAGRATRFKTNTSKLLHKICGQEMILYGTKLLEKLEIPITIVVGFQKEDLVTCLNSNLQKPFAIVEQTEQLGTGHAVSCTQTTWGSDNILVINGDMPLVTEDIITTLLRTHNEKLAEISFVTASHTEPSGYGRVVKDGNHISIVEAREFTKEINDHPLINAGIYIIKRSFLKTHIASIDQNNSKKEFYLTDLVKIASDQNKVIATTVVPYDCIRGINTLKELWAAEHIKHSELIEALMLQGVRFISPLSTHIDLGVSIGAGTVIGPNVQLQGTTVIGKQNNIQACSIVKDSQLGDNVTVHSHSVICDSKVSEKSSVGPFAHVYNYALLKEQTTTGTFCSVDHAIIDPIVKNQTTDNTKESYDPFTPHIKKDDSLVDSGS